MATKKKTSSQSSSKSTAVTKREPMALALPDDLKNELIREQLAGLPPEFPIIKILHAGAQLFDLGTEKTESFSGVIIDRHRANAFWKKGMDQGGGGQFPDCVSYDGITGQGDPGGVCENCPHNQFGSDGGRGKKCKNTDRSYVLLDTDDNLPSMLMVPPTSLKVVSVYATQLGSRGIPIQAVWTRFSLASATNKDNIEFSKLRLSIDPDNGYLPEDELHHVVSMRNSLLTHMRQRQIQRDDLGYDDNNTDDDDNEEDSKPTAKTAGKGKVRRKL